MSTGNLDFEVNRTDFATTRIATTNELANLTSGQVRFRINRFALTANNITYAATGDQLDYWGFFPTEEGWGRIPAMGWADLVESKHPEIAEGGRYYGWFPMSKYLTVDARPSADGLLDEAPHRAKHAPIYRAYAESSRDPLYNADREDEHALLRGLFATAFLADDFFFDNDFFGARTTVVLSASSKTAIGFAHQTQARDRGPVVGVTSQGNVAFVESLGYYSQVVSYDDVEAIRSDGDALLVDLSGNGSVVERVHKRLESSLRYSMAIGASHLGAPRPTGDLPGPQPAFFFAPKQAAKRVKEWSLAGYGQRVAGALGRFVEGSGKWLTIERSYGPAATKLTYRAMLAGKVSPHLGQIVSLWNEL